MQNTSSAVMQQRAAREVEADDAERAKWRALDFFPTPPWAARAGAELIGELENRRGMSIGTMTAWEPACGEGHISQPIAEYFASVFASDIHAYGYPDAARFDFLTVADYPPENCLAAEWIITNPPFLKAAEFVERGLRVAKRGVAVLCRQAFLESERRFKLIFGGPLTVFAPFIERVPMQLGSWDPAASTATAYAWFVFHKAATQIAPIVIPIPPGTKARLTKPDDVARFARRAPAPLIET